MCNHEATCRGGLMRTYTLGLRYPKRNDCHCEIHGAEYEIGLVWRVDKHDWRGLGHSEVMYPMSEGSQCDVIGS